LIEHGLHWRTFDFLDKEGIDLLQELEFILLELFLLFSGVGIYGGNLDVVVVLEQLETE